MTGLHTVTIFQPAKTPLKTKSGSAFVEFDYALTDRLKAFASLRYIQDDKSIDYNQYTTGDDPAAHNRTLACDRDACDCPARSSCPLSWPCLSTSATSAG